MDLCLFGGDKLKTEESRITSKLLNLYARLDNFPSPRAGSFPQSCLALFAASIHCNPNLPDRETSLCRVVCLCCIIAVVSQPWISEKIKS